MKIETSKKALRIVSWFNIIAAVLLTIFGLFMFTQQNNEMIQEISKSMNMTELKNIPLTTFVGSIFLASAIATALEAWLLRRAAKDGKKSTFIIIITILSLVSQILGLVKSFNASSITTIAFNAFILYLLFNVRKEEN